MRAVISKRDTTSGSHGSGSHHHGHGGVGGSGYVAPATQPGYGAQQPVYGAQQPSYGAQQASYGGSTGSGYAPPQSGYGTGSGSYGAATSYGSYDDSGLLPDLTPLFIGVLVVAGLSLLFPTYVKLATVQRRRRRDLDERDVSPMTDVVERVNDIYMSVVESEECMERIACEIGGLATDVGLKNNAITQLADPFVPSKYKGYYKQFRSGQNCHKIKCGTLF